MTKRTSKSVSRERQLLALVCQGLDDKKAGDLKVIDVRGLSSITDYIVIATGLAEPHLRAMRIEVEKVLDDAGAKIGGMDKNQQSGWLVVDAYQIMVHLFTAEARTKYGLEQLWRDGKELTLKAALGEEEKPAEKPAKASPAKKKAAGKKKADAAIKDTTRKAAGNTKRPAVRKADLTQGNRAIADESLGQQKESQTCPKERSTRPSRSSRSSAGSTKGRRRRPSAAT